MLKGSPAVCLTVDVEGDCPPYLETFRGIEEGLDRILALFAEESLRGTFFATGRIAEAFPEAIQKIVSLGHELGSHGWSHRPFDTLDRPAAVREIRESMEILRFFSPVIAFRAPNLRFPEAYVGLLADAGYAVDSSLAKYKLSYYRKTPAPIQRIPVSATSSVLRLPGWLRFSILAALSTPVVLFVHPWEFVDLTREKLRLDCRFRTGPAAVACLKSVIGFFRMKNARFLTITETAMAGRTSAPRG